MPKEDLDVSSFMTEAMEKEGLKILTSYKAIEFKKGKQNSVICEANGNKVEIKFDEVILAIGRKARTKGFGIEELGIRLNPNGTIETDEFLRTNFPNIFVCGDAAGPYQFTHTASHQAWYASVNALFGFVKKFKADYSVIPWTTFTDPEVAHVGLIEAEAKEKNIEIELSQYDIGELDRAIADGEAIRNKYYDGDKTISDKQIRDEITNYGNSIRQSQTQVEEKLSEIKSLMLLQSKLEDAENNIAPKKTGFIRDKDKIAVREKRRELAEAMKKLTVTLSEDDIAGLNERKLTQIANKIEEVQKVLDGYEKIKNKANFDYNDAVKKKQQELDDLMSSQKALLHYAKENLTNLVAKYQDKLDKKQYSKNPTLNKLSITDSEYQKLKNQLEAKKEQLKSERDNFRNNNADYLLEIVLSPS